MIRPARDERPQAPGSQRARAATPSHRGGEAQGFWRAYGREVKVANSGPDLARLGGQFWPQWAGCARHLPPTCSKRKHGKMKRKRGSVALSAQALGSRRRLPLRRAAAQAEVSRDRLRRRPIAER